MPLVIHLYSVGWPTPVASSRSFVVTRFRFAIAANVVAQPRSRAKPPIGPKTQALACPPASGLRTNDATVTPPALRPARLRADRDRVKQHLRAKPCPRDAQEPSVVQVLDEVVLDPSLCPSCSITVSALDGPGTPSRTRKVGSQSQRHRRLHRTGPHARHDEKAVVKQPRQQRPVHESGPPHHLEEITRRRQRFERLKVGDADTGAPGVPRTTSLKAPWRQQAPAIFSIGTSGANG